MGVTLVEVLVAMAIVVLLATLSYPALVRAIESGKRTRSLSQMRQLHVALMLYCDSQSGEGPNRLGLPHWFLAFVRENQIPPALLRTGGSGWQRPGRPGGDAYTWMVPNLNPSGEADVENGPTHTTWLKHIETRAGNPILLLDATYPLRTEFMQTRRVAGLYFDGHIETRFYSGSPGRHAPWEGSQ